MKRFLIFLSLFLIITSCDNEQESPTPVLETTLQDSIQTYKGSFISAGNAAVLKGNRFIFQVKMDSSGTSLKDSLLNYKSKNRGVVPVEVKGKVTDNPMPMGYSQIIEIKEIVNIDAPLKSENDKN